jgi:glycerol uptake facilitator-like aquaporin
MNSDGRKDWYSPKRFMVESIGTFCITYFPWLAFTFMTINLQNALSVALCSGCMVTGWSWLARERTGAHFNPALTLGYMVVKEMPISAGFIYMLSQFIGAIFAGGLIYFQLSDQSAEMDRALVNVSNWAGGSIKKRDAFILEMLSTMFMTFCVMNTVLDKKSTPESYAIVYGSFVAVNSLVFNSVSGGMGNPAKMVGPSSALFEIDSKIFVIMMAQFTGGLLGGVFWNELFNKNKSGKADSIIDFFSKYDKGEDKGLVAEGKEGDLEDLPEMSEAKGLGIEVRNQDYSQGDLNYSSQKLVGGREQPEDAEEAEDAPWS